jgi:hypothetical protein
MDDRELTVLHAASGGEPKAVTAAPEVLTEQQLKLVSGGITPSIPIPPPEFER